MPDDIVTRLRDTAYETEVCWEAAGEIERLRQLVDQLAEALELPVPTPPSAGRHNSVVFPAREGLDKDTPNA